MMKDGEEEDERWRGAADRKLSFWVQAYNLNDAL